MKIQVNSDKSISVDASLIRFVEAEMRRVLKRFASSLTRIEVHLSDVDSGKSGQADKNCLIEARPAGVQPLTTSARASRLASAVSEASRKMKRLLTTFFGRRGRKATNVSAQVSKADNAKSQKAAGNRKTADHKKRKAAGGKNPTKLSPRGPKKKRIYQARRKPWPKR